MVNRPPGLQLVLWFWLKSATNHTTTRARHPDPATGPAGMDFRRSAVASRFVWKFGAALPVPLADALSRRTTIVDLCHSG